MTNETNSLVRLDCKMCGLKMYDSTLNEVYWVYEDDDECDLPTLWRTRKDAQIYAKRMYPHESAERREMRINSEQIMSYDDQYCADELEEESEYD